MFKFLFALGAVGSSFLLEKEKTKEDVEVGVLTPHLHGQQG